MEMDEEPVEEPLTRLLAELTAGNTAAADKLIAIVYPELRRRADYYMRRERPGHTLQPTALVNEAYLKLIEGAEVKWRSRAHFFAVAARLMRRILIDYARKHKAEKHGGNHQKFALEDVAVFSPEKSEELVALDEALMRLEQIEPRQSRIIELRHFGGLSVEETAEVLGLSPSTVKLDWRMARAWLHRELRQQ